MKSVIIVFLLYISKPTLLFTQEISCNPAFLTSDWQCLGPYEYDASRMGKVMSIWADPQNINTLYAGTSSSGLWKTTDAGLNWANVFSYQLAGVGVQEIEQAEVFLEGPSYTVNALYGSTMFEGSNMSRFGLGLIYFDPFDATAQGTGK